MWRKLLKIFRCAPNEDAVIGRPALVDVEIPSITCSNRRIGEFADVWRHYRGEGLPCAARCVTDEVGRIEWNVETCPVV